MLVKGATEKRYMGIWVHPVNTQTENGTSAYHVQNYVLCIFEKSFDILVNSLFYGKEIVLPISIEGCVFFVNCMLLQ